MIVYGWIEIFYIFVFLFQKIRLLWHSLKYFEAKSAMDNKLSITHYKCILIFKYLWTVPKRASKNHPPVSNSRSIAIT